MAGQNGAGAGLAAPRVLVAGESWVKHTVHMKGFDHFHSTEYEEGGTVFIDALSSAGIEIDYVRAHEISGRFPRDRDELAAYDAVILSDVGANSFLLTDETFLRSEVTTNRLAELAAYVAAGGGLVMVGGYLSFAGIDGRARYAQSPLAEVLPVTMLDHDDRVEVPQGVTPEVAAGGHPAIAGVGDGWPRLLGYNRLVPKADATVVAKVGADPLLVVGEHGDGRTAAFASDCAPHWAPPEFVEWPDYAALWSAIVLWAGGRVTADV
ncbi:MAG TPA: glutamine amidotransferase [Solirubrobacterales bacterium]|nr:glutamine amidotransferase [Solirubrobacterales bacterium]